MDTQAPNQPPNNQSSQTTNTAPEIDPATLKNKKILLVEDEIFISDLYAYDLTKEGLDIKVANDGITGLNMLKSGKFDLLLLDLMLPGMNGIDILKTWKQDNPTSNMKVLILTNYGQDDVIKTAMNLGIAGYLIKSSYTPDQVVEEVKKILSGQPASIPLPTSPTSNPQPGK